MIGDNLRDAILELLRAHPSQAMSPTELGRHLGLPLNRRADLRQAIQSLAHEGLIQAGKKTCFLVKPKAANTLTGNLKFHPKGHAFFFPDPNAQANLASGLDLTALSRVHIARRDTGTALDGDQVLVSIHQPGPKRPFRTRQAILPNAQDEARGKVETILSRRSGRLVGVFQKKGALGWIECDDKAIDGTIDLIGDTSAQPGQLVVVDLENWNDATATPRGRIIEVLGWPGDAGIDMLAVIHRFGLRTSFPEPVLAEARAVPETPTPAEIARRKDWRRQLVITIDPADAKDHDDAIWLEKTAHGWSLAVHIADVSHYIKPGSPMDREAIERGNSTYLVDRVLPMLPTELSNGICSLKPDVDRLTKAALLDISAAGEITRATFVDAVIHSRAKLSYEQAQAILDGQAPPAGSDPQLAAMVREGGKLAAVLRQRRFARGALDLDMPEIKIRLDDQGRAVAADPVIHTASHQLVEECMLAANEAVARILRERMKPAIYRIHDDPDPSRLLDYTETVKLHGYRPGDLTNRTHIQRLLDDSKGSPEEHIIKLGLLKSLKRAAYSAEPTGHYGLAKADYCHFTSPIRRYADLIVHRALQPLLANPPPRPDPTPAQAELREIARHISDTERTSAEAESESKQIKLFDFLQLVVQQHDPHVFDGLITDVRPMGLMVEIPDMGIRGVVKREDLPQGRWRLEAHRKAWVSSDGKVIQLGMRIPLHVTAIDREKRFVDFAVAGRPTSAGTRPLAAKPAPVIKHRPKPKLKPAAKPAAKAGPPVARKKQRKLKHRRR
jgi:ribonuclease R